MHAEAHVASSSEINLLMDENCVEGHSGRRVVDNHIFGRDLKQLDIYGVDQCGSQCKVKMLSEMSLNVRKAKDFQLTGFGTCNGKEKGFKARKFKDKINNEVSENIMVQPSQGLGEKSRILFLEDEDHGLNSLQMLADVSLNSKVQDFSEILRSVNKRISSEEDKGYSSAVTGKYDVPISLPVTPESDDAKILVQEDHEYSSIVEVDGRPLKATKLKKRQIPEGEIHNGSCMNECKKNKEEVWKELRHSNADVSGKGMGGELAAASKHTTKHRKVADEAASVSFDLKLRNTCNKNSRPPWFRPSESSTENGGPSGSLIADDVTSEASGSYVVEIGKSFRHKARSMVDAAVLAMSSLKEGENAYTRITEALDCMDNQRYGVHSNTLGTRYSNPSPLTCQKEVDFAATVNASNPSACFSSGNEAQILSELISDCIAIVFMIQATSERQYPPAHVARILKDAAESLQPRCLQNLPLHRDIEQCMGYIITQMLALVATPNGSVPAHISVW